MRLACEARYKYFIWVAEAGRYVLDFYPLICLSEGHASHLVCVHSLVLTVSQGEVFDVTLVEHVMDLGIFAVCTSVALLSRTSTNLRTCS